MEGQKYKRLGEMFCPPHNPALRTLFAVFQTVDVLGKMHVLLAVSRLIPPVSFQHGKRLCQAKVRH